MARPRQSLMTPVGDRHLFIRWGQTPGKIKKKDPKDLTCPEKTRPSLSIARRDVGSEISARGQARYRSPNHRQLLLFSAGTGQTVISCRTSKAGTPYLRRQAVPACFSNATERFLFPECDSILALLHGAPVAWVAQSPLPWAKSTSFRWIALERRLVRCSHTVGQNKGTQPACGFYLEPRQPPSAVFVIKASITSMTSSARPRPLNPATTKAASESST